MRGVHSDNAASRPGHVRPTPFRLGEWQVDPQLQRVRRNGREIRIEPKFMEVLSLLASRPGEVLSRDELLDAVWAGADVHEHPLNRAISELRKTLGDDPARPRYIETIRKRGYRLIAPVGPAPHFPTAGRRRPRYLVPGIAAAVLLAGASLWFFGTTSSPSADGAVSRPLTSLPGREYDPAFSPDGRQVAFAWDGGNDFDLYLVLTDGGHRLQLTRGAGDDRHPAWSNDGSELAFVRRHPDGTCSLHRVGAFGGRPLEVSGHCAAVHGLAWSPDGSQLAIGNQPEPGSPSRIELVTIATGEVRVLTTPPTGTLGDHDPEFSPDGDSLAFTRVRDHGVMDIYRIDTARAEAPVALTNEGRKINGFDWSSDGRFMVFNSTRSGTYGLWRLDLSSRRMSALAAAGENAHFPDLSPDRRQVVFEDLVYDTGLRRLSLADGTVETLLESTRWDAYPAPGPDDRLFVFASNRSGPPEIWVRRGDGDTPRPLTEFGGTLVGSPAVSPDGRRVAFDARPDGHADIFVGDVASGRVSRVVGDPADDQAPFWSPRGDRLYFASNRTGRWQILSQSPESGGTSQVTETGGYRGQAVDDGIYFARTDTNGIWFQGAGASAELVVPELATRDVMNWFVAPTGIYYIDRERNDAPWLMFLETGADSATAVRAMDPGIANQGLAPSPDGHWIYYAVLNRIASDLRILAF